MKYFLLLRFCFSTVVWFLTAFSCSSNMAQKSDCENSIDITDIRPSPQRVRNILTLKERVAVIEAYDRRPMYTKVARMFNCSWEQIKNIVANRDAIMEFYNATLDEKVEESERKNGAEFDLKERKIKFLGECVYESIKRLHYHAKQPVTEELIRLKALEFQDILKLVDFKPNKKWMNMFKANYNISLSNKQIAIHTAPPASCELKDIMTYCTKQKVNKANNSLQSRYNKFDTNSVEYESKRLRKLNFLQEALSEYMLRVKVHHKSIKLTSMMMRKIAIEFNEILKVQDFEPTLEWVDNFMKYFDSQLNLTNIKKPPLSLDLKDILSYCSRMHNKTKAPTITLAPKETALQMRVIPKFPGSAMSDTGLKFQQNSIIYLDEDSEKETKPDIGEMQVEQSQLEQPPPLKIRKIESINNDAELQRSFTKPQETIERSITDEHKISNNELQKSYIIVADESKERLVHINSPSVNASNVQIKEEIVQENEFILPTTSPQNRIPTITTIVKQENTSTPTTKALDDNKNDIENEKEVALPRHVTNFKDILLLLKPLEEYAMLKENYRAIGLITQLEEVFKNQPQQEEEFIG